MFGGKSCKDFVKAHARARWSYMWQDPGSEGTYEHSKSGTS